MRQIKGTTRIGKLKRELESIGYRITDAASSRTGYNTNSVSKFLLYIQEGRRPFILYQTEAQALCIAWPDGNVDIEVTLLFDKYVEKKTPSVDIGDIDEQQTRLG